MKKYVVIKRGTEYNDETYSIEEGGTPLMVFNNLDSAIVYQNDQNFETLKGLEIGSYGYEPREYLTDFYSFAVIWKEIYKKELDEEELCDLILPTNGKHLQKLLPFIKLKFFEIFEVESQD